MLKLRIFLLLLVGIFALGCQTTPAYSIENQDYPINVIIKTVVGVLPGGLRKVSSNRREFSSQYFRPGSGEDFNPDKAKERYFVKVIVIGEERPYKLDVLVPIERSYDGVMTEDDYSDSQAIKYTKLIKDKLGQSREDRNVIDDFRAF